MTEKWHTIHFLWWLERITDYFASTAVRIYDILLLLCLTWLLAVLTFRSRLKTYLLSIACPSWPEIGNILLISWNLTNEPSQTWFWPMISWTIFSYFLQWRHISYWFYMIVFYLNATSNKNKINKFQDMASREQMKKTQESSKYWVRAPQNHANCNNIHINYLSYSSQTQTDFSMLYM